MISRYSILLSGEQARQDDHFWNAILKEVPEDERIITIEDISARLIRSRRITSAARGIERRPGRGARVTVEMLYKPRCGFD